MTHLWSYRGKAQKGIPAIDSKFHYLNHFDTFGDIIALYNSRIYNVEQGSDDIAGTILAIWNDRYVANERNIILENIRMVLSYLLKTLRSLKNLLILRIVCFGIKSIHLRDIRSPM